VSGVAGLPGGEAGPDRGAVAVAPYWAAVAPDCGGTAGIVGVAGCPGGAVPFGGCVT
jgi:hypothetical protein